MTSHRVSLVRQSENHPRHLGVDVLGEQSSLSTGGKLQFTFKSKPEVRSGDARLQYSFCHQITRILYGGLGAMREGCHAGKR